MKKCVVFETMLVTRGKRQGARDRDAVPANVALSTLWQRVIQVQTHAFPPLSHYYSLSNVRRT